MTAKPASNGPARRGMVVAPERRASEAGLSILLDGGTAIEAAIATAAVLGVTYPHMTGIGGDAFWLIHRPGHMPVAVMGCGSAGAAATLDLYRGRDRIPSRGPIAANTVAGAVSSWKAALELEGASRLGLPRLLRDAIALAGEGAEIATNLERNIAAKDAELRSVPGWSDVFGKSGNTLAMPRLARTFEQLGANDLGSFYSGPLSQDIAADLAEVGAPVSAADLRAHKPTFETPLSVHVRDCELFNTPPPTQGFASLLLLALADRLPAATEADFAYIHSLVEATKLAFAIRNREIGDPAFMSFDCQKALDDSPALDRMAATIDRVGATPWPRSHGPGDTVWIGTADSDGCVVSTIQSIFFEFGSGVVLPRTGILWQNRGSSFGFTPGGWNALKPGRKPFHTLNPALARFDDGRVMAYGTMGGEGQPQTQAALFTRYARHGMSLAGAIDAPRWLLGRTWGEETTALRVESRFDNKTIDALCNAGHPVQMVEDYSDQMGHAGAILRHADGRLDGASDPRCDGSAAWA